LRPTAAHNHYLFTSNDNHRKFNDDFDVRTHASQEARNNFIFINVGHHTFMIRSATNPDHYLFAANDKSRGFGDDFDVRTHAYANEERNKWIVEHHGGNHYTLRSATN